MNSINTQTVKQKLKQYKNKPLSILLLTLVILCSALTVITLFFIIIYILIKGIPHISISLFEFNYNSENCSLTPALINTFITTALALLISVPLGIFSAIYLVEYAKRGNKIVGIIRMTTETLSGIPSIIYGLFGYLFFVVQLKLKYSVLSGTLTLAIMILPLIIRTTEEALKSVPDSYREGSFGLGAGKLRTVFPEQDAGTGAHMPATVPAAKGPDCRRCDGARRAACPPVMEGRRRPLAARVKRGLPALH